jgi:uncharacterized membrane protein/protein-disulfide isomerase
MNNKIFSFSSFILGFIGAAAAGMSWYERSIFLSGSMPENSICSASAGFNCQLVSTSSYATVFGVPLAAIGFGFYLLTMMVSLYSLNKQLGRVFTGTAFIVNFLSVIFSLYLLYISKYVLNTLCLYCVVMYMVNAGLFLISYKLIKKHGLSSVLTALDSPWILTKSIISNNPKGSTIYGLLAAFLFLSPIVFHKDIENKFFVAQKSLSNNLVFRNWDATPQVSIEVSTDKGILNSDIGFGNPDAKIQIVEFSDFECGACRNFHTLLKPFLDQNKDKIYFVNKTFPLDQSCNRLIEAPLHKYSCYSANFVRCSAEQGKYWEASNYVYETPVFEGHSINENQLIADLFAWAKQSDMDLDALSECVKSNRQMVKVKADIEIAAKLNIQQTPTFYVNGRKTKPNELLEILNELLKK